MPTKKAMQANPRSRPKMDPAFATVKQAWRWYGGHWKMAIGISALSVAPILFKSLYATTVDLVKASNGAAASGWVSDYLTAISWLLVALVTLWSVWGTVALYLYILRRGKIATVWRAYADGRAYYVRYLWVGILVGLAVIGGALLFLIPGIYLAVIFSFAPFIILAERTGVKKAFWRSNQLVSGYWWPVVGRVLIMALSVVGAGAALGVVGMFVIFFCSVLEPTVALYLSDAWSAFMDAAIMPPTAILTVLLYHNLKKLHAERS